MTLSSNATPAAAHPTTEATNSSANAPASPSVTSWLLGLLLVTAIAAQTGHILSARSPTGETPFHSANDRSRWCTVASLGGYGTYEIDRFLDIRDPSTKRRTWHTIDLVRHRGNDGKQHYYSSKPPLLSTLHAGVYAVVRVVTGFSLLTKTFAAARTLLIVVNLLPLIAFWLLWIHYFRRQVRDEWSLAVLVIFMLWGTFVSTFANTLNNHLPGTICAGLSLWALLKVLEQGDARWRWFAIAGLTSAMAAACELPALSWLGLVGLLLFIAHPRLTITGFLIGTLPVAVGFAATNYMAHGDLRPPYAHRAVGDLITTVPLDQVRKGDNYDHAQLADVLKARSISVSDSAVVRATRTEGILELWDEATQFRFALVSSGAELRIHQWDDWYDYPNSYWYPDRKQGIDRGERSIGMYTIQSLFGHHGIFSLTPMWCLLPLGALVIWRQSRLAESKLRQPRVQIMLAIIVATLVCFTFYMVRPLEDRNYGGVSCGFRWMFWFTPLWLWILSHALQTLQSARQKRLVSIALFVSIFSATFPWANPWSAPWIMQTLEAMGWVRF